MMFANRETGEQESLEIVPNHSQGALELLLLKSIKAFSRKVVAKGKSPFSPALNIFCLLSGKNTRRLVSYVKIRLVVACQDHKTF